MLSAATQYFIPADSIFSTIFVHRNCSHMYDRILFGYWMLKYKGPYNFQWSQVKIVQISWELNWKQKYELAPSRLKIEYAPFDISDEIFYKRHSYLILYVCILPMHNTSPDGLLKGIVLQDPCVRLVNYHDTKFIDDLYLHYIQNSSIYIGL